MKPLAVRARPSSLAEFVGQEHLVGKGSVLRKAIDSSNLHSMIFWGPPGVGKTTLAKLIAKHTNYEIHNLNATSSGVKQLREVIQKSSNTSKLFKQKSILFIDEIHRFSKSQQDSLLKAVEDGTVVLIGATTENPSFEVISPLLSRCQVYTLKELSKKELELILSNAIKRDFNQIELAESDLLIKYSGGDARKLLTYLEILINQNVKRIDNKVVNEILNKQNSKYDKSGEFHYDTISAFIKSIRGSDPQAALYYLALMLDSGEDIKFIARRLLILASEDIGLANPEALTLANSVFNAVSVLGMPEARIPLSQLTIYLACSDKDNSAYKAINSAMDFVKNNNPYPVPLHLRNSPTKLMEDLGYGKDYKYSHDFEGNSGFQEYLPKEIKDKVFYESSRKVEED